LFYLFLAVFGDVQVEHPFSTHGNPIFDWDSYLKETSSTAAPAYCFKQVSCNTREDIILCLYKYYSKKNYVQSC
jgi:hypothetical protein